MTTQRRFSLFQSLLAGDVDFRSKADRAELLTMAKEALGIVLDLSNGHLRADRQAKISWGSNGQRRFTMEAGTDEATFVRRMEDVIVRLQAHGPGADAIHLRDEFRAVPYGERSQWIDNMVQGGENVPFKVRKYADEIMGAVAEEFREELQGGGLGSDELQPVITLVRAFVIGANPGLGAGDAKKHTAAT